MRDHSHHIELSRDEAVRSLLEALPESFGTSSLDQVLVSESVGRVLAQEVTSKTDIPNVLTCAMDSIAVHWSDFEGLAEGQLPDTSSWKRGVDWEFANTGVAMPEGFDTAVVVEHVTVSPDEEHVEIHAAPSKQFAGTRAVGSNMPKGTLIEGPDTLVTPDIAARIASAGHSCVSVRPRPRVAFIPTGNELVPPNVPFSENAPQKFAGTGKVYESNSVLVESKVSTWGGAFVPFDIVPDERAAIKEAILKACEVSDIVVLNAGSSKGSDDWCVEVLEEIGQMICHQTNHGPGHHSSYAIVNGTPIVGISGPSGGASFTLNFYLLPVMKRFLGLDPEPQRIPAKLMAEIPKGHMGAKANVPKEQLSGEERPAEATKPDDVFYSIKFMTLSVSSDGTLEATPVKGHPGTEATQHANAYYMMPAGPGANPPQPGDVIPVELRQVGL